MTSASWVDLSRPYFIGITGIGMSGWPRPLPVAVAHRSETLNAMMDFPSSHQWGGDA